MCADVFVNYANDGRYPLDGSITANELEETDLSNIVQSLNDTQQLIRNELCQLSSDQAANVDGWIAQARNLQTDLLWSTNESEAILSADHEIQELHDAVQDVGAKYELLVDELEFNQKLNEILGTIHEIKSRLDEVQASINQDSLYAAATSLQSVDLSESFPKVGAHSSRIKAVELLEIQADTLRQETSQRLITKWASLVRLEKEPPSITFPNSSQEEFLNLSKICDALRGLGRLPHIVEQFCQHVELYFILPRLRKTSDAHFYRFDFSDDRISRGARSTDVSAEALSFDLRDLVHYLDHRLQQPCIAMIAEHVVHMIVKHLLASWLPFALPNDFESFMNFNEAVTSIKDLAFELDRIKWPGKFSLDEVCAQIPGLWVKKRQEVILNEIRSVLRHGWKSSDVAERHETRLMAEDDTIIEQFANDDEWSNTWSDDDEPGSNQKASAAGLSGSAQDEDADDMSAWGLDANDSPLKAPSIHRKMDTPSKNPDSAGSDLEEAWGWGDDNDEEKNSIGVGPADVPLEKSIPHAVSKLQTKDQVEALDDSERKEQRQVTLTEKFHITTMVRDILARIKTVDADLIQFRSTKASIRPSDSIEKLLADIPTLALALYRAGSFSTYEQDNTGLMFLYNDSLWLVDELTQERAIRDQSEASFGGFVGARSAAPIKALKDHAKRAYAKEMDVQRTILTDLLDGAQGFTHSTEHPFNQECDVAVSSCIDQIKKLHRDWASVLSHSALLQSIGSLLATICSKMIVDIEDMADISEAESQQLVRHFGSIATLESFFVPESFEHDTSAEPALPMTAVYTSSWLKFQYLNNLLESSLVDIKYLWTEGELSLEFGADEVVDLIVALFADGPHRRSAISEIKASTR